MSLASEQKTVLVVDDNLGAHQLIDALLDELSRWSEHPPGDGQQDDLFTTTLSSRNAILSAE